VVGVVARIDRGDEVFIKARRGVILAAGGFIMNKEMVRKYAPDLGRCNYPIGSDGDDGRGIRMGMGVGGAAINMHEGLVTTPYFPPPSHIKGLMVNAQGQRFINEDCYHGRVADAILRKADGTAYLIVDDELYGQTMAGHKIVAVEETYEALEKELGMPEGQLVYTIEFYNRHAERGEDPLLHKAEPYLRPLTASPYAALNCSVDRSLWAAFTLGGLETRTTGEVLGIDGAVISGLYAAGRTSAGLTRSGRHYASGMSIGGSSFFGRLAGKRAAAAPPVD
jgi:3-oxo-5alpha-steroid 4-dehydrogenase